MDIKVDHWEIPVFLSHKSVNIFFRSLAGCIFNFTVVVCLFINTSFANDIDLDVNYPDEQIKQSGINKFPGYKEAYVNDYAQLLAPEAEQRVREQLIALRRQYDIEMTVLTIESLRRYGSQRSIEHFATTLFNRWGIGSAERNDGVLVLVSRHDRKMRIEIGSGYSRHWDVKMKTIINRNFLPHFKRGEYQSGIELGVREVISVLTKNRLSHTRENVTSELNDESQTIYRGSPTSEPAEDSQNTFKKIALWAYSLLILPFLLLVKLFFGFLRRRPKTCQKCANKMTLLSETDDDEHLDGGQRLEEYLESADYDVWRCSRCDHMLIKRYRKWSSLHGSCKSCGYQTLQIETTTLQSATIHASGRKRIDYSCDNCGFKNSETRVIPKKSNPSSRSGSSFSGGGSRGGGASGSW